MKPTRAKLADALEILLTRAIANSHGNPYCVPEIKHALKVLACERGLTATGYLDVEVRNLPIPE